MLVLDIILALLLLWALFTGFHKGFFVQLAGLAGLIIGVWLAMRSGRTLGLWLGIGEKYAAIVGFLIILVLVILLVASVGRLFKGIFGFAGLSLLDKLAGMVLSAAKIWLILGLLLWGFDSLNRTAGWVSESKIGESVLYRPMVGVTAFVFPYLALLRDTFSPLWEDGVAKHGQDV
ncbi:MAG: CvpA family protein [Rikenellaceae bacterium]|nr:CvpA family protein [Rikenellaceae bacterium]